MGELTTVAGLATTTTAEERTELARERAAALEDGTDSDRTPTPPPAPPPAPDPSQGVPEAPAPPPSPPLQVAVVYQDRFNLLDLLELYECGRGALRKRDHARWMATFALAAGNRGILSGSVNGVVRLLAVFWTTKNVNVDLVRDVPRFEPEGNYIYVAWFWNETEEDGALALRRYIRRAFPDAEFIAWHDQRGQGRRKKPVVLELAKES